MRKLSDKQKAARIRASFKRSRKVISNMPRLSDYIKRVKKRKVRITRPDEILKQAAALYAERNKVYKDNILRVGNAMHAMFPNGLTLETPQDWHKLHIMLLCMVKWSRYATNFKQGHRDSVRDNIVYPAILAWVEQL